MSFVESWAGPMSKKKGPLLSHQALLLAQSICGRTNVFEWCAEHVSPRYGVLRLSREAYLRFPWVPDLASDPDNIRSEFKTFLASSAVPSGAYVPEWLGAGPVVSRRSGVSAAALWTDSIRKGLVTVSDTRKRFPRVANVQIWFRVDE